MCVCVGMCMVVSSEEEEVEVTNVKEGQRKRKVKSLLSLEQIMDGVRCGTSATTLSLQGNLFHTFNCCKLD